MYQGVSDTLVLEKWNQHLSVCPEMLTRRNPTAGALGFAFLLILWINEIITSVSNSKLATDSSGALFTQMSAEHERVSSSIRSPITEHHISFDWVNYTFYSNFSKSHAAMSIELHLDNTRASYRSVFQHPPRLSKKVQYTALPLVSLITSMYRQTVERLKRRCPYCVDRCPQWMDI